MVQRPAKLVGRIDLLGIIAIFASLGAFGNHAVIAKPIYLPVKLGNSLEISTDTMPLAINANNDIAGSFANLHGTFVGFIRYADGRLQTIGFENAAQTLVYGINKHREICGFYSSGGFENSVGFVRLRDGTVTTFDPSGSEKTEVHGINDSGVVVGFYQSGISHGFIRSVDGTITTFDPDGSTGTYALSINSTNAVTGGYIDASGINHGFVRAPDGTMTTFDAPGATQTTTSQIADDGTIVGTYSVGPLGEATYPYVRAPNGTITEFDPFDSGEGQAEGVNASHDIVGFYQDAKPWLIHGFVRNSAGTIKSFDMPGGWGDTWSSAINSQGTITGTYREDGFGDRAGYLRLKQR